MESPPVTIVHHESEFGEWESVRRDPDPRLRLYVRSYEGYVETRANFSTRMEVPSTDAVMIINLGPRTGCTARATREAQVSTVASSPE